MFTEHELAILCIDDEPTILNSIEMELKQTVGNDYLIEFAESGEEALEICEEWLEDKQKIALVISDCMMPGMKGDEVLRRIHNLSPDTRKIMLTGQADLETVSRAIQYAKIYRYIPKPWQPDDFKLTVKEALHSYHKDQDIIWHSEKLQKNNQALIQLNQEKNEFLGIAAHDLKNPLSAIQGWAEMISEEYDEMSRDEVIDVAHLIIDSSRRMFELIRNLLDVNAIESGKINISLVQMDMLPIVQKLIENYNKQAKLKNITLQLESDKNQYDVLVDKNAIEQVLDNLISNAIKYSPYDKKVSIEIKATEKSVQCQIKDEGPGLSDTDQNQLFCKFIRLTPKPTGKEHSTGLGLFIVKKLVTAMNGKVWCKSQLGKGSTFFVEFPISFT
jgi:two-component system, sensor histidine kinase and response regulator